jgi:hypothetical protein
MMRRPTPPLRRAEWQRQYRQRLRKGFAVYKVAANENAILK